MHNIEHIDLECSRNSHCPAIEHLKFDLALDALIRNKNWKSIFSWNAAP